MWLVKAPRHLSQPWSGASGSGQVGKLQMARNPGKSELFFTLHEELPGIQDAAGHPRPLRAPGEHPVLLRGPRGQALAVRAEDAQDLLSLEGQCCSDWNADPPGERSWRRKGMRRERSHSLAPTVQVPSRARHDQLQTCRQSSVHKEYEKKKKEDGKRVRADKDQGLALLFAAFGEHQCYCMKDSVGVTLQPELYPEGILHEVAVRVAQGPHKSAWKLKAEYGIIPQQPRGGRPSSPGEGSTTSDRTEDN